MFVEVETPFCVQTPLIFCGVGDSLCGGGNAILWRRETPFCIEMAMPFCGAGKYIPCGGGNAILWMETPFCVEMATTFCRVGNTILCGGGNANPVEVAMLILWRWQWEFDVLPIAQCHLRTILWRWQRPVDGNTSPVDLAIGRTDVCAAHCHRHTQPRVSVSKTVVLHLST